MAATNPTPLTWTLRFKSGRHTVLLFVDSLTPLNSIKTSLLTTLQERYPLGFPEAKSTLMPGAMSLGPNDNIKRVAIPDPQNIDELELGVLADENDPDKGFQDIIGDGEGTDGSAKALGLKDGAVLAFRFKGERGFSVKFPSYEDVYPEEDEAGSMDE